jgi:hypothetical protein
MSTKACVEGNEAKDQFGERDGFDQAVPPYEAILSSILHAHWACMFSERISPAVWTKPLQEAPVRAGPIG